MRKKNLIIILIVTLILLTIRFYNFDSKKILVCSIVDITLEEIDSDIDIDGGMNNQQKDLIKKNLNDYIKLRYIININNSSDNLYINNINIQPVFSSEMQKNVIWFSKNDMLYDSLSHLDTQESRSFCRIIYIKRNAYTNDELINLAKQDKLKIRYTSRNKSIFSSNFNTQYATFK